MFVWLEAEKLLFQLVARRKNSVLTMINPPLPLPGGGGCGGISAVSPYPERREEIDCFS
jgi:hypothetical protein